MDVLARRKTGGYTYIKGDIRISGFRKKQQAFAKEYLVTVSKLIFTPPQVTIKESLIFSAFLIKTTPRRQEVKDNENKVFVDEVTEILELNNLKTAKLGFQGSQGCPLKR
ncbi:hypothetical protein PanWU01x14_195760 [Parasponia andersonii]|uniref:Uncharacterized protein n=1 Tax=Parasponia andersonii TaxID=3476 RepID=A0A2P5BZW6_PARAD|nr:hypothetical protein PanWU01x14_195760 [Parasponia andersonii]